LVTLKGKTATREKGGISSSKKTSFNILLGFVIGLVITYTSLGILLGLGAHFIYTSLRLTTYFYFACGLLLLIIGLALLGFLPFLRNIFISLSLYP